MAKNRVQWDDLNERQQAYLTAIYQTDQEAEASENSRWHQGLQKRPADVWRWLRHETTAYGDSLLKGRIRNLNMLDPGTGATYNALEARGLILCQYANRRDEITLSVRMTTQGRKLVRQATGAKAERLERGELREWHWNALTAAYRAGDAGLDGGSSYGGILWKTWLRLCHYGKGHEAALAETIAYQRKGQVTEDHRMHITHYGIEFYERHYAYYRQKYPDVTPCPPKPYTTDAPLQRWHWEALARLYPPSGFGGVEIDNGLSYRVTYGGIPMDVWARLLKFSDGKLVRAYHMPPFMFTGYWIQITAKGIAYYENEYEYFHKLYPDVDAIAPIPVRLGLYKDDWGLLARLYAGEEVMSDPSVKGVQFKGIPDQAIRWLLTFPDPEGVLITLEGVEPNDPDQPYRVRLTDYGKVYYERHHAKYPKTKAKTLLHMKEE